jgi:hypothetical protein
MCELINEKFLRMKWLIYQRIATCPRKVEDSHERWSQSVQSRWNVDTYVTHLFCIKKARGSNTDKISETCTSICMTDCLLVYLTMLFNLIGCLCVTFSGRMIVQLIHWKRCRKKWLILRYYPSMDIIRNKRMTENLNQIPYQYDLFACFF